MKKAHIVLASGSPRRREILQSLGISFTVMLSALEEPAHQNEPPEEFVQRLAQLKASDVACRTDEGLVIGADTVVVSDHHILGKPQDEDDARQMLEMLSGRWHRVLTGVCLIDVSSDRQRVGCEETRVKFAELGAADIEWYISTGEPMDKAGAYAIQGYGALFIERIEGDYFNVVGLPVRLVYRFANELGIDLKR
jgi:septum formation protein